MLTGKEKRQLRALGNQIKSTVLIGKEGITPKVKRFIEESFNKKTLVKVKILDTCGEDRTQVAAKLDKLKETDVVQILGRTILLYRPLREDSEKN